jgi:hypothetical protein
VAESRRPHAEGLGPWFAGGAGHGSPTPPRIGPPDPAPNSTAGLPCRAVRGTETRGKRGAYRVGYIRFREFGFILLVTVWGKNDKSDLSASDRNAIAAIVRDIRRALGARRE